MTCEKLPLIIAESSCVDDWLVETRTTYSWENGRALCAELRVAGPPEGAAINANH